MRLSDLLHYTVRDSDGIELGRVSDVRIVQDGRILRGVQAAFRVDALVVGRGGVAERLGYMRARVNGPWLVRVLLTRFEQRAHVIEVDQIDHWDDDAAVITLRAGRR
ncbi:MAG: hypothetical protein JWN62_4492 [Acidimicrobiales bacterium]|nr:hypothetical protein [Acidimicrobiales bacterium]